MQKNELKTDGPNKHFSDEPTVRLEPPLPKRYPQTILSADAGDSFHKRMNQTRRHFLTKGHLRQTE